MNVTCVIIFITEVDFSKSCKISYFRLECCTKLTGIRLRTSQRITHYLNCWKQRTRSSISPRTIFGQKIWKIGSDRLAAKISLSQAHVYYFWGELKSKVEKNNLKPLPDPRTAITKEIRGISNDELQRVFVNFTKRARICTKRKWKIFAASSVNITHYMLKGSVQFR